MKVLYDHQIFTLQQYGGISRYFCELIKQFSVLQETDPVVALTYHKNNHISELDAHYKIFNLKKINPNANTRYIYGINTLNSIRNILNNRPDIFHPTYYGNYYQFIVGKIPVILTVHDLTHEKYPEFFRNPNRNYELKREAINKADLIIAISENTKDDIVSFYDVNPQKIKVIYHGNTLTTTTEDNNVKVESIDLGDYLLFVGARSGYKNFDLFLKSIAPLLIADCDLKLICAGGGAFTDEEIKLIDSLKIRTQVLQMKVTDQELILLYQNGRAFIFPSLYEGFGMPILEAMGCQCPVILSRSSSFPEIAGDAAVYFDPQDSDSIRDTVQMVIYNESKRTELILRGSLRVKQFTWSMTALNTLEAYKQAIEAKK